MRGGPKRPTAHVLIIQHTARQTEMAAADWCMFNSCHPPNLGLNYSSDVRGENAKHTFEYLSALCVSALEQVDGIRMGAPVGVLLRHM